MQGVVRIGVRVRVRVRVGVCVTSVGVWATRFVGFVGVGGIGVRFGRR